MWMETVSAKRNKTRSACRGLSFSHKKERQTDTVPMWRNLENMILSDRSQSQKATYPMIPFI